MTLSAPHPADLTALNRPTETIPRVDLTIAKHDEDSLPKARVWKASALCPPGGNRHPRGRHRAPEPGLWSRITRAMEEPSVTAPRPGAS